MTQPAQLAFNTNSTTQQAYSTARTAGQEHALMSDVDLNVEQAPGRRCAEMAPGVRAVRVDDDLSALLVQLQVPASRAVPRCDSSTELTLASGRVTCSSTH